MSDIDKEAAPNIVPRFYVATIGNDSNPGTVDAPFLTIAHALSVMTGGDHLLIRAGSYEVARRK